PGVEDLVSGCEDDGAYLQLLSLRTLGVVDRIGLASGCAEMTVAADAAREATFSLGDCLVGGVAGVDLIEVPAAGGGVERGHRYLALHQYASGVHDVLRVIRRFQLAARTEVLAIEPAIDRVGGLFAREHRRHHHVGTGYAIAAGEHTGQRCLHRQGIGSERSRFRSRETQPFTETIHIGYLANRSDDSVAGDDMLRAWNRFRSWSTAGVGLAEPHLQTLQANHAPVGARLE